MGVFCAPEAHGKPRATLDEGLGARKPGYANGRAMVGDGDADPPPASLRRHVPGNKKTISRIQQRIQCNTAAHAQNTIEYGGTQQRSRQILKSARIRSND